MNSENSTALDNTQADGRQNAPQETPKVHKKHRGLKIFLGILASILLVVILVGGWFGVVPGASNLLGANKPRDLGIRYSEADYQSFLATTKTNFLDYATAPDNPLKPGKKTVFADPVSVNGLNVSDVELTAAAANTDWLWMPLKNAQVKFSPGTVEVSGNIDTTYLKEFINFIGGVGYSQEDIDKGIEYGKKLVGSSPALYFKAKASVTNDVLSYKVEQVQVNRFSVPIDIASKVLGTGTSNAIIRADNFEAKSVTATDGALIFSGTYPSTIYVKH